MRSQRPRMVKPNSTHSRDLRPTDKKEVQSETEEDRHPWPSTGPREHPRASLRELSSRLGDGVQERVWGPWRPEVCAGDSKAFPLDGVFGHF